MMGGIVKNNSMVREVKSILYGLALSQVMIPIPLAANKYAKKKECPYFAFSMLSQ